MRCTLYATWLDDTDVVAVDWDDFIPTIHRLIAYDSHTRSVSKIVSNKILIRDTFVDTLRT